MEKYIQKQQALELYRTGYSYGAIAKQIGEAKSTVYRWVNEDKESSGTAETPAGTGFGTDLERNETINETNSQNETVIESNSPRNSNEVMSERTKLSEVEIRKAELQHEYRMEELKFQQEQYRDKRNAQREAEETEQWRQQIEINRTNNESLLNEKVETNEQIPLLIPVKFISRLGKLLKQYLSFDDIDCSLELLEVLEEKVNNLYFEINDWADEHDFDFKNDDSKIIIDNFITDLEESLENFAREEAETLTLTFDESWKRDVRDWLELNV